ncbi:MAG: M1 family aminopeptidase [Persephonella sp.]|nr:M1 family aminopeptidase [Persephonella sp.]
MDRYLQKTEEYIKLYSQKIGKFPYKRFAIVENFFPTGYSMPTFTLIGQQIIRFPFVINQSLPHEILHQWFGCSIYVDDSRGNWAEGLTTYLSDYYFSEDKRMYRKNSILKYMAYAKDDYPLTQFRGKIDRKSEAIGYGKTMMFFYMLEEIVGREKFYSALNFLYQNFRFKRVSWEDIKSVFENEYRKDLDWFFNQWIERKGIPDLQVSVKDHTLKEDGFHIKLKIKQKEAYRIKLPVFIETYLGMEKHEVWIDRKEEEVEIVSQDEPLRVIVDRDYQIFRKPYWEEINPVIHFTLADRKAVVFLSSKDIYSPITAYYTEGTLKNPDQFSFSDIYGKNVVVLGADNPVLEKIFGKKLPAEDFVEVFKNPFGEDKVITVFNLSSNLQAKMVAGRIKHYGKYSKIKLNGFRIVEKSVKNYQNGMSS